MAAMTSSALDWDGYQTLLDLRGERPQPRMAYLDGVVELDLICRFIDVPRQNEAVKLLRAELAKR
jgi:hypothetical protein